MEAATPVRDTGATAPSAHELARLIRTGQASAVEALDEAIARIGAINPALNAVVSLDLDRARDQARAADRALRVGQAVGPLHGVPITLKDGHDVAGLRTTVGTDVFDRIADEDGAVAARLRAAGAIVMGHTNVPPFLADYQTANPLFGRTSNPWDLERTPGGSSGGAAAAVAAGMTPLEVGSDLTGSLRIPAAFCGIYGLRTTDLRVAMTGFFRPAAPVPRSVRVMSALGPMARDLDDLELLLRVIAGPDGGDPDAPPVPIDAPPVGALAGVRVAVAETLPGVAPAAEVRALVAATSDRLSNAGARVEQRLPPIDWEAANETFQELLRLITGVFAGPSDPYRAEPSAAEYLTLLDERDRVASAWQAFFDDVDVLVLPGALGPAFRHAEPYGPIEIDGVLVPYLAHGGLHTFANVAGLPSLAVPAGRASEGLPLGLQLVGPRWSDGYLIQIARAMRNADVVPEPATPPLPPRGGGTGR